MLKVGGSLLFFYMACLLGLSAVWKFLSAVLFLLFLRQFFLLPCRGTGRARSFAERHKKGALQTERAF